jgi:hypothetical protein
VPDMMSDAGTTSRSGEADVASPKVGEELEAAPPVVVVQEEDASQIPEVEEKAEAVPVQLANEASKPTYDWGTRDATVLPEPSKSPTITDPPDGQKKVPMCDFFSCVWSG